MIGSSYLGALTKYQIKINLQSTPYTPLVFFLLLWQVPGASVPPAGPPRTPGAAGPLRPAGHALRRGAVLRGGDAGDVGGGGAERLVPWSAMGWSGGDTASWSSGDRTRNSMARGTEGNGRVRRCGWSGRCRGGEDQFRERRAGWLDGWLD